MKRPFMGIGIALAAGVVAGWLNVFLWLTVLFGMLSPVIVIAGYKKLNWTDRTCKYFIGLSVFFVVGFCRGSAYADIKNISVPNDMIIEIEGTVKRIQKKNKVDYIFVENEQGEQVLVVAKKEMVNGKRFYKGQIYGIRGMAEMFESATNPGQFDEGEYYRSQDVSYRLWAEEMQLLEEGDSLHRWLRWIEDFKENMQDYYENYMGDESSGILMAAVLGERSALDPDMKRYYQKNGWMHLITTSGLHLSFVSMNMYRRMRKITLPVCFSTLMAWLLMLGYGYITDYGDSMLRAMGMMVLVLTAKMVGRRPDGWTNLVVLAALMLFLRPDRCLSTGFVLTYAAVGGMEFGTWIVKTINKDENFLKKNKIDAMFRENFCVQTGIFLVTLPVLLLSMYEIPVFGFFYNFFMIPLVSFIVPVAFLAGTAGVLDIPVLRIVIPWIFRGIDGVFELVHHLPSKVWVCGCPEFWQVFLYIVGIFIAVWLICERKHRVAWMCIVLCSLLLMSLRIRSNEIVFMDVGQGDGICILTKEGHCFFVDGGSTDVSNVFTYRLEPLMKYYGVDQVDGWFVTHGDQDHVSGILEALDSEVRIQRIFLSDCSVDEKIEEICKKAENKGIAVNVFRRSNRLRTKDLMIECLYPVFSQAIGDKNNDSMVLSVYMEEKKQKCHLLLTGDLEMAGEKNLLKEVSVGKVDVLKVAHHGSSGGTGEEFLEQIKPEWGIISCGKENRYGHPHKETLERLSKAGCRTVSTALNGAVSVRMTSKGYVIYGCQMQD